MTAGQCVPGCGRCCSPVTLPYRYAALTSAQRDQIEPENRDWIEEHLTEISPRRTGLDEVRDYMKSGITDGLFGGRYFQIVSHFYRCDWYDPDTRECKAHDQRPPICSGYPWYGDAPDSTKAIPPQCGFLTDVNVEPIPVQIVPRR